MVKINHSRGFSLIELVTVVVLLGILGVAALGRFGSQDVFAVRGFFDDTVTATRFAQKLAISCGCDVRVEIATSGYTLRQSSGLGANDFVNQVSNPANRSQNYQNSNIPNGFTFTSSGNITFNSRGLREEATSSFALSDGSNSYSFSVHSGSGLVQVL